MATKTTFTSSITTTVQILLDCGHEFDVSITVPKTAGDGLGENSFCPICDCEQDICGVSPAHIDVYTKDMTDETVQESSLVVFYDFQNGTFGSTLAGTSLDGLGFESDDFEGCLNIEDAIAEGENYLEEWNSDNDEAFEQEDDDEMIIDAISTNTPEEATEFRVVEDNSGGLHLFVFLDNNPTYYQNCFEYNPGQILDCVKSLAAGADIHDWDSNEDEILELAKISYGTGLSYAQVIQRFWQEAIADEVNFKIVAGGVTGKWAMYPKLMGVAAKKEFGMV